MRKSKRSAAEIEAEELTDYKRRSKRNQVFKTLVPERDRGWGRLKDYNKGQEVIIDWTTDKFPDNMFGLKLGGKLVVLDAEELRRFLRWI